MKMLKIIRMCASVLSTAFVLLAVAEYAVCTDTGNSDLRTPGPTDTPHINGATMYGARPGHPFLYRIPCTGKRPMKFSATGLPASLELDPQSGIISGEVPKAAGDYAVRLKASNVQGSDTRQFRIVVGDRIGLTPQMGWNDWYTHYDHVTDRDIRNAASAMVTSRMADYGYQFVDIDDGWMRKPGSKDAALRGTARDHDGQIRPNDRFPNMRALTDYIHSLGLKAGIYTSPGPTTCAGFEGSYQHEIVDARRFAAWGFDLLKYDWCSYTQVAKGKSLQDFEEPYLKMGGILKGLDRDLILNICQYGMAEVWKWGREVGGNSWRTTGDLGLVRNAALPAFYTVGFVNAGLTDYAGPGGWNDPDYILIGTVGDANNTESPARLTSLTHEEQYSYMSMWSLMAAPLMFSGDMMTLDDFTLNVLCNSEVIDIDQDSLGRQGTIVKKTGEELVLKRPLGDGSLAVGLFNLTASPRRMAARWNDLGLQGSQTVRDVWRQRDLSAFSGSYSSDVPPHGVMLVRLTRK